MKIWRTMDAPDAVDREIVDKLRYLVQADWLSGRYHWWALESALLLGARIGIWVRTGTML